MQAGQFDTRVTFQKKGQQGNGGGGYKTTWSEFGGTGNGKRWAAVWPVSQSKSDEDVAAGRIVNALDYKLIVRADRLTRQITSSCRVVIDGEPYAIQSVARADRTRGTITMIVQIGKAS